MTDSRRAPRQSAPRAKKSLGQNFCCDPRLVSAMTERLQLSPATIIWEIGPGPGALSRGLLNLPQELHLFEVDHRFRNILEPLCRGRDNVFIHWQDIMQTDKSALHPPDDWIVCGNLPYFCGTAILQTFLEPPIPRQCVFLLQKEVVEKTVAQPGDTNFGFLSVRSQLLAEVRMGEVFPPESFQPSPKVFSAILEAVPFVLTAEERLARKGATHIAGKLFEQRRKMALPTFRKTFPHVASQAEAAFARLGIPASARPQEISPSQFLALTGIFPPDQMPDGQTGKR
jgi:16S rRNA (adenine1518-N6/adenine1519-N6)-dimethyltransferase